jgi:hypothetical protein
MSEGCSLPFAWIIGVRTGFWTLTISSEIWACDKACRKRVRRGILIYWEQVNARGSTKQGCVYLVWSVGSNFPSSIWYFVQMKPISRHRGLISQTMISGEYILRFSYVGQSLRSIRWRRGRCTNFVGEPFRILSGNNRNRKGSRPQ